MKNDIYKYLTKEMMAKLDALIAEKGSDVIYNEVAKNIYENRLAECLGMEDAYEEKAPHKICAYIYELANAFNGFYHETKILSEEDPQVQASYIGLLVLTKNILETCIDVLGFSAPDRM